MSQAVLAPELSATVRAALVDRVGDGVLGAVRYLRLDPDGASPALPEDDQTGVDSAGVDSAGVDVHLGDRWIAIGPWPGSDACPQCLRVRWQRIRGTSEQTVLASPVAPIRCGQWPVVTDFLLDAVAAVLETGPVAEPAPGTGTVTLVDIATLGVSTVGILADPCCPSCAEWHLDRPVDLELRPRPVPRAGTHRLRALADYPLPESALINELCGAIGASTWQDLGSPTTAPVAGRLGTRSDPGSSPLTWSGQSIGYGASALVGRLEGLERYAGSLPRIPAHPVLATLTELRRTGVPAVDPAEFGRYSRQTYESDHHLSEFTPDRRIPWNWAYSLRDRQPILLAQRNCYYGAGSAADNFVDECSSGCASGSCLEEALLYGLLEVIERDAFLLAWYGNVLLPLIAVDSSLGTEALLLLQRAELLGYEIRLFDNRIDLDVPVVTALAIRRNGGDGRLVFASAAALDPAAAVAGALGEVLTYLPSRAREVAARRGELQAMAGDYGLVRQLRDHAELFGLPAMAEHAQSYLQPRPARTLTETFADRMGRRPDTGDLTAELTGLVEDVASAGFDVLGLDQTCAEQRLAGISGVRVMVPGMIPIDFGWSKQRVLTIPRLQQAFEGPRAASLTRGEPRLIPHPFP